MTTAPGPSQDTSMQPLRVRFLVNVAAFAVAEIWGYRTPAAPAGDDEAAHQIGQRVYLAGAIWAVPSMVWHAYPSRRVLERLERGLDRDGARSRLNELAGGPATPGVQQH